MPSQNPPPPLNVTDEEQSLLVRLWRAVPFFLFIVGGVGLIAALLAAFGWQSPWFAGGILLIVVTYYLGWYSLNQAMQRARLSQESLSHSYRELDATRASLEQRITERTLSLEKRTRYLEASAEIARAAASILDTDQLIRMVVELIHDHFDLYYVGLFLVDEANEWAVLRAGSGEAGKAMLARSHRIKICSGMIGWSIANAQPRIALEAGEDAVRLATPELPETRSEAALPLRSRGQVLGTLTVQSVHPEAFDQDIITVLQTMVDQVALAMDNARLLAESQAALETTRRAYGEMGRRAWQTLLAQRREWGYRYTAGTVSPMHGDWPVEMVWAMQSGQSVQNSDSENNTLAIPLRVREHIIGAFSFRRKAGSDSWRPEEIVALETLTREVSQALESARLHQEVQRRALREQLIGQVAGRIRETLDLDTVMQTAVQEIRQALNLHDVTVRFGESGAEGEGIG